MLEYRLPPVDAAFYQLVKDANRQREINEWCKEMSEKNLPPSVRKKLMKLGFANKDHTYSVAFKNKRKRRAKKTQ